MDFRGVRVPIIVLTLLLTLVFLFGARWLYQEQALDQPLQKAVRNVPGVTDVALDQRGDTLVIKVKAGDTDHLEAFVAEIWRAVDEVESTRQISLEISDSRNQYLEDLYYEFHFCLQEAIATGRYSDLPDELAAVTAGKNVSRQRVFVGSDYVYLQLHQGSACLYEVVPRVGELGRSPAAEAAAGEPVRTVTVRPWESSGS